MTDRRIKWAARFTTLAAVIILIMVFVFVTRPVWFIFPLIMTALVVGIAWLLPVPEVLGAVIVIGSIAALINIVPMNYDIEYRIALVAPWVILLAGGVLYLIIAWRSYRIKK